MYRLSIIICTWNRPIEITHCIKSIINANPSSLISECEVIIIDDGKLPDEILKGIDSTLKQSGYSLRYIQKDEKRGTFFSRILGIKKAKGDIILFIDDDAEMEKNYLETLLMTYNNNPEIAGVGGVDILLNITFLHRVYYRLFFLSSRRLGKLSISGFCNSYLYWKYQSNPFLSEFLIGHNMSFKKQMIPEIPDREWLKGYCPGEDIYISYLIGKEGLLMVNPQLKIKHSFSDSAREVQSHNHYKYLMNFFHILDLKKGKTINYVSFGWTVIGLILRGILKLNLSELKGYFLGVKNIFKIMIKR
jgi:glycosyltransferase involved in cell wall biosynthesis